MKRVVRALLLVATSSLVVCGVKGPPRPPSAQPPAPAADAGPCCSADGGTR